MKELSAVEVLSIGATEIDSIRRRLDCDFRGLQEHGVDVKINESNAGNLTFLGCDLQGADETGRMLVKDYVANALSDIILGDWRKALLRKIIRTNYYYFDEEEQEHILKHAASTLEEGRVPGGNGSSSFNCKQSIRHKILDYLTAHDQLVVDGFITFRLKEYMEELEDAVDRAVDDFLLEREYKEFIRLLKHFVDVQEPTVDQVHVLLSNSGTFSLVDDQNQVLNREYLKDFVVEMTDGDINYEDLLISALVTIAPRKIVIHCPPDRQGSDAVVTVNNVFAGRVTLCQGCSRCCKIRQQRAQKKD